MIGYHWIKELMDFYLYCMLPCSTRISYLQLVQQNENVFFFLKINQRSNLISLTWPNIYFSHIVYGVRYYLSYISFFRVSTIYILSNKQKV